MHSAVTWRDVEWLRSVVKSKLLLKGILHPADAELAIRAGVDGIMISNHGGRNLDTIIPTHRGFARHRATGGRPRSSVR